MLSTLLRTNKIKNQIGLIEIDATIREVHDYSTTITQNPVENGAVISEHVINQPKTLQLEAVITNTPLSLFGLQSDEGRAQRAFDSLEEMYNNRELFDVVSGFKLYNNCLFSSISIPRTRYGELRFSATIMQLQLVQTDVTTIPTESLPRDSRGYASSLSLGAKEGNAVPEERKQSILRGLARGVGF